MIFIPPVPQATSQWDTQINVTFRDISGIQKKAKTGWVYRSRDGFSWDRAASQTFEVPMKVTNERKFAESGDSLTCDPNYDDPDIGTTSEGFKRLPTGLSFPMVIQIELGEQRIQMKVASNAPPSSVEAMGRVRFGQNVESSAQKPIT
jgi:hypothetical protein